MRNQKLSVIIIAKNEEKMIGGCLKSIKWVDEIIVVDTGSTDKTIEIAKKFGARVFRVKKGSFDYWRTLGLRKAQGEWLLYIDADERATPALKKEILSAISHKPRAMSCYDIPRLNILFGKPMHYGSWWPDDVTRLFKKKNLKGWQGIIHESPFFEGEKGRLKNYFIHLTHRNLKEALATLSWTKKEALLLYKADHPPVTWWRILRITFGEFLFRILKKQGFRDGTEGFIEALLQSFNKFCVYTRLWELQK